jgi:hypothetical protein
MFSSDAGPVARVTGQIGAGWSDRRSVRADHPDTLQPLLPVEIPAPMSPQTRPASAHPGTRLAQNNTWIKRACTMGLHLAG